jgi:riboflavin biosynthesis pyrimidine reductase
MRTGARPVRPSRSLIDWLAVRQIFPAPAAATTPVAPAATTPAPADATTPALADAIDTVGDGDGPPTEAAVAALAALYAYPDTGAGGAPWVRANMVASVDGAATLDARSAGLSNAADRTLFKILRSLADVIVAGAGTARAERYRPVRDSEVWPRLRRGRTPTPPIAVLTRGLSMSADDPLLTAAPEGARTIVLTTQAAPPARRAAVARHADLVVAGRDDVAPADAVAVLAERGYRRILIEGGPTLLGQFVAAGLLDELCLTVSPLLEGGHAGRILAAPPDAKPGRDDDGAAAGLTLGHVLEDHGFLFCRYLNAPG